MRTICLATPFLAIALAALPAVSLHAQQQGPQQYAPQQQGPQQYAPQQQGPQPYAPQQRDRNSAQRDSGQWDAPPPEFRDAGRQGFHDGIEAARFDVENRRGMDPRDARMFRHPPVRREQRHDYREGFIQGYNVAMQHTHDGDRDHRDHDGDHHDGDHHDGPPQQQHPYGF